MNSSVRVHAWVVVVDGPKTGKRYASDPCPTEHDAEICAGLIWKEFQVLGTPKYVPVEFSSVDVFSAWQQSWAS